VPLPCARRAGARPAGAHEALAGECRGVVAGEPGDRPAALPPQPLASQLSAWAIPLDPGVDPATALRAVLIWSRLHGIVSLEIAGNFASMGIDAGQLFEIQLSTLTA
jgi:Tetracyclin repressor-like, C-terminal domain